MPFRNIGNGNLTNYNLKRKYLNKIGLVSKMFRGNFRRRVQALFRLIALMSNVIYVSTPFWFSICDFQIDKRNQRQPFNFFFGNQ